MVKEHLLKQAFLKVDKKVHATEKEYVTRLIDEYTLLDMEETLRETPTVWLPRPEIPVKKAKEIALEAAVKMLCHMLDSKCTLLDKNTGEAITVEGIAEGVYQWLIKKDDNG